LWGGAGADSSGFNEPYTSII